MISRSKLLLNVYISFTLHFLLQRREIVIGHFKCFIFSLFLVSCHEMRMCLEEATAQI